MKATLINAMEIENAGGAILASNWTTGRGNYVTRRPVPAYCEEIKIRPYGVNMVAIATANLKGKTRKAALRLAKNHPKAQKLICVVDRRGLNAAIAKAEGGAA